MIMVGYLPISSGSIKFDMMNDDRAIRKKNENLRKFAKRVEN
jgi:hypothetical protein